MRVKFWGTRGSIPVAPTSATLRKQMISLVARAAEAKLSSREEIEAFVDRECPTPLTFGGCSSCVQVDVGSDDYVLCDLGSGVRAFAQDLLERHGPTRPRTFHVLMSHLHWDHIMGFPFFVQAYVPGNVVRIYGCHDGMEEAFRRQHGAPSFPVDFSQLPARIEFVRLPPDTTHDVAGLRVRAMRQRHAGDSYGWRIEHGGSVLVYSTDSEHRVEDASAAAAFVELFRDADLVVFDAMYSLADAITVREDWGHSSNVVGVELCQKAGARHLVLFHHEPALDDDQLRAVLAETRRFEEITRGGARLEVSSAYDGMEIVLG